MKDQFTTQTPYAALSIAIPGCFVALEQRFDAYFPTLGALLSDPRVALAENLCRRMGDVEFYASVIPTSATNPNHEWSLTGTYLVGHFVACKSVLDAAAIAVTMLYQLTDIHLGLKGLAKREQDLTKGKFWSVLSSREPTVYKRYSLFRQFAKDVQERRDVAVHRVTPLVTKREDENGVSQGLLLFDEKDADVASFSVNLQNGNVTLVELLHFHHQWQPTLLKLCDEVCKDIAVALDSSSDL